MKSIGSTLIFLGIAAIIMNFMNMVPSVLVWIYSWGEAVAWAIKIGLIAVGALLYFMSGKEEDTSPE